MRNLKRALSLTLASVMLLGMMVVGSSAAGFPDVDDTKNVEAIEVLQAVAVMVGDKDTGNFRPDAPVSRAEMAVIMSNLLGLTTSYYVSTCPFEDVSGSYSWARGPVGAAYASKVLSGRTATTFDPAATVTAVEAASMIMRGLGYFKYAEDFADGFNVATVRQANLIGLFSGIKGDATTPLTRNQVAQMALNALQANIVDFTGTPGMEVNGVTVGYRAEYTPRTSPESKYAAIGDLVSNIGTTDQYYVQLGEELYDGDLRLDDDAIDDFGRPSRCWSYKSDKIGTYAKREIMRKESTTGVTGSDMYSLLGSAVVTDSKYSLDVYVDGALYSAPDTNYNRFIKANFTRNNDKDMENTGRGVLTEVYVNDKTKEITVAIINTYLAKAISDYSKAREELRVEVYYPNTQVSHTLEVEDFPEITDMKEGDFMLVKWVADSHTNPGAYSDYSIVTLMDTEIMTDKVITRYSSGTSQTGSSADGSTISSLVTDGQTYDANAKLEYKADTLDRYFYNDNLTNKTYNIYLDQYGNAIGVELYSGTDNYVFVTGFDLSGSNTAYGDAKASAIFLDGTMKNIQVNVKATNDNIKAYNADPNGDGTTAPNNTDTASYRLWDSTTEKDTTGQYGAKMNTWYTYTQNETTGVYTLSPVEKDRQFATALGDGAGAGNVEIKSSNLRLSGYNYGEIPSNKAPGDAADGLGGTNNKTTQVTRAYGDQNSVFLTVGTSQDTKIGEGYYVINEVKNVYTGVQNVNIKSDDIWYDDANGKTTAQGGTPDTGDPSVYAVIDGKNYIIGAVIVGKDSGSTNNYAYIYENAKYEERASDGTYYWGYNGIVNGEKQELKIKSEYTDAVNTVRNILKATEDDDALSTPYGYDTGYLFRLSFDADGYVVGAEPFESDLTASTTSAHNDYIFAYKGNNWNINTDDEVIRYMKIAAADADELVIDRAGLTLYNEDESGDKGLAVREDAKITIIQGIRGSRKISEATGLKEAWDYLVDYDKNDANGKNYVGTISAVLDGTGRATWVVFDSKGGTNPSQNEEQTESNVPAVKVGTNATAADIKTALSAQKYGVYSVTGLTGKDPGAPNASSQKNIRYFTFNTKANGALVDLIIVDKDNQVAYAETGVNAGNAGFHYFFVDIGAGPRTTGSSGYITANNAFPKGEYTYTIRIAGQDEVFTGTFNVG